MVLSGYLNDLWKYHPLPNEWTWVSGSNLSGQSGTYGSRGIPSASNTPGARANSVTWVDSIGNLWLFGGRRYDTEAYGTPTEIFIKQNLIIYKN